LSTEGKILRLPQGFRPFFTEKEHTGSFSGRAKPQGDAGESAQDDKGINE
jgi:hypothetical protein